MRYRSNVVFLLCLFMSGVVQSQDTSPQEPRLVFEGNRVFSEQELLDVANDCLAKSPPSRVKQDSTALEYCLRRVKRFLHAKGYLQAELSDPRQERSENGLKTIVSVNEGARYRIGEIEISGARLFSPTQIREIMGLKTGDIACSEAIGKGLFERVPKAYSNFGYIHFTAEPTPTFHLKPGHQEGVVDLTVTIEEGEMFTIRSIKFEGSGSVPEDMLQREMLVRIGDAFNRELFNEGLKRISQVGLFEKIDVDKDVNYKFDNERAQLDITVRLKKPGAHINR